MGPVSNIIIASKIDEDFKETFRSFIVKIGGEFFGNDIDYKCTSILFGFGWEYPEEISEYAHLKAAASLTPESKIHLSANCNSQEDHKHLGELCFKVCAKFEGVVEFCDDLRDRTEDRELLEHPQHYFNDETSQLGPELMKKWLGHNDFHMVK